MFRLPARVRGISPSEMKFQPASPVTVTPVSAKKQHTGRRGFIKAVQFSAFFVRRPDWPKAKPEFGLSPDLNEAARIATREMIDFLVSEKGLSRDDAYMLCSLAVDLRVTQLVDDTKGVHAMLPKSIFR